MVIAVLRAAWRWPRHAAEIRGPARMRRRARLHAWLRGRILPLIERYTRREVREAGLGHVRECLGSHRGVLGVGSGAGCLLQDMSADV